MKNDETLHVGFLKGVYMPRKNLIRTSEFPYHISTRSNNKEWFYIPTMDVWRYLKKHLSTGSKIFEVEVEAFVLMSNHYHLLITTPKANIDLFMQHLNKNLSKSISRQADRINRIFGASYRWNLIQKESYYMNVLRYIYQNPLRAGLVSRCEEYQFSNLKEKDFNKRWLDWFNYQISEKEYEDTKRNLRKFVV